MVVAQLPVLALAAACSATGVLFAAATASTAKRLANLLGLFAGMTMLGVALAHLAPEALRDGAAARISLLLGVLLGAGLEIASRFGARSTRAAPHLAAYMALGVLALHSTLDGAVYSAAFLKAEKTGLLASLGLLLHEAPEGIVATILALQTGLRPGRAILLALAASTITTPVGLLLADATEHAAHGAARYLFAGSAGLLTFVGARLMGKGWSALRASG